MSIATVGSAHIVGLHGEPITVEVDVGRGLYSFSIIGLPDKAIDESKDRVVTALKNTGLQTPKTENQKVVVSLSPAGTKKEGSHFDLPIALGYLNASGQIKTIPKDAWFFGELSLKGDILPLKGMLALAEKAKASGITTLYIPEENKREAGLVSDVTIYPCRTLLDIVQHLGGEPASQKEIYTLTPYEHRDADVTVGSPHVDMSSVRGQAHVKRALEIAATGGHNIALYGPPGTGKTMLAKAFTGILPLLTEEESLEVTRIYSTVKEIKGRIQTPQLRSPHHTSSHVALVGGGANIKAGEITLAHHGVLFLDEFPEFEKRVIESLREPLEEGVITISRAKGSVTFPANITLIASMNPCPCGYYGSTHKRCTCSPSDIDRYVRKLSGPIMDRIDMWVPVPHISYETLTNTENKEEDSATIRTKVFTGRSFTEKRSKNLGLLFIKKNKDIPAKDIEKAVSLTKNADVLMKKMSTLHTLSPRAYHRVLRVARTIADYRLSKDVEEKDILEAFQYRPKLYQDKL